MDVTVVNMNDPFTQKLHKHLTGRYKYGTHRFGPNGCVLASPFKDRIQEIRNFEVREDDVWILTFPKCGTTWTQELVWLLMNNLNFERALEEKLGQRSPYVEVSCFRKQNEDDISPALQTFMVDTVRCARELPSPRLLKSHLPVELLPEQLWTKKPKIIHVAREPKDVAVSYYHHNRMMNDYNATDELFFEAFMNNYLEYTPFWDHVLGFWKMRIQPNFYFNTFEDMKKDLTTVIRKIASFLDKTVTDEQVSQLTDHLDFKKMRDNLAVNNLEHITKIKEERKCQDDENLYFMRKGEVGGWKRVMSPEMVARFDSWTKDRIAETGYPWPHCLQLTTLAME